MSSEAERDAESEKLVDDVNQCIARLKMGPSTQVVHHHAAPISVESTYTLQDVDKILKKLKSPARGFYSSSSLSSTTTFDDPVEGRRDKAVLNKPMDPPAFDDPMEGVFTGSRAKAVLNKPVIRKKPTLHIRTYRDHLSDPDESEMEYIRQFQFDTAASSKPPLPPVRPKIATLKDVKSMTDEIKHDMLKSYSGLKKGDPKAAKETLIKYKDRVELVEKYARQLGVSI